MTTRIVAIDGPAASGKSSVARELARQIGFDYVNSGAMYRAVTWHVLQRGIDPADSAAVVRLLEGSRLDCDLVQGDSRISIDGVDPAEHLRDDRVNDEVSRISSIPRVREILVAEMRGYAKDHDVVMEGRDIGSVVFPETPYKFYIDASPDVRLRRRIAQGQRDQIAARDRADSSRRASPLIIAEDAHVIDSSNLTIEGVVGEIIGRLKMKGLIVN
ncbi:MAG TPA: (d)CMP kinase [Chthoniobacterales bacterium]|nr:(d)CMP kinase [Chthoniobacterales bacterium]